MTGLGVRAFRAEDLKQLGEIALEFLVEDSEEFELWVHLASESNRFEIFVAEVDTEIVGLLVLELAGLRGNLAEIHAIAVRWEHQRRGVGSALMKEMERYARGKGVERIHVSTNADNKTAIPFYIKNGYVPKGVLAGWGRKGDDQMILAKNL